MGKIIAFSNQKGGVGKTTTCVNVSAYLAGDFGKKVLLVDLDPQGNASSGLGIQKNRTKKSSYNLLCEENIAPNELVLPTEIKGLSVIPSNIDLAGAEIELVEMESRESTLKRALEPYRDMYDYITIDCPPSLGLLTINALGAADSVFIPIQAEFYALEGLSQLLNTLKLVKKHKNPKLKVEGVALTMFDSRATISNQIANEIRNYFKAKLYDQVIPRNVRLAEAPSHGVPIMLHDKHCPGAKAYRRLTKEFLRKEEN